MGRKGRVAARAPVATMHFSKRIVRWPPSASVTVRVFVDANSAWPCRVVTPFLDRRKPTPVVRRFTMPLFQTCSFLPSTSTEPTVRPMASAWRILSTRPLA